MLRPARAALVLAKSPFLTPCRTKVVYLESMLDKAERLKLWNKENRLLYGPLLETHKSKIKWSKVSKLSKHDVHDYIVGAKSSIKSKSIKKYKSFDMKTIPITSVLSSIENKIFPKTISSEKFSTVDSSSMISNLKMNKSRIELVGPNTRNNLFTNSTFGVPSIIVRNLKMFPMMRNQQIEMEDKKSESTNDSKILRITSSGEEVVKFPSVSRILDRTMSEEAKAALEKWKQQKIEELGIEGFAKFNKTQLDHGKQFHSLLSNHFLSTFQPSSVDSALEGVWSSVAHVLKDINSPKAIESHVVHPVLKYKGIIDCIAVYQDKPTLIEWKKSDKPKTVLASTYDNPVQLAAYFGAISHDTNYKQLNVKDALLVIAYTDGAPADIFHLNLEQMRQHWASWLTRLEKFLTATEGKNVEQK